MNTTTPDERNEKEGLAREPRELSSEELESIIGGIRFDRSKWEGSRPPSKINELIEWIIGSSERVEVKEVWRRNMGKWL